MPRKTTRKTTGKQPPKPETARTVDVSLTRFLPLSLIDPGDNPREAFDDDDVRELAESIDRQGLLQPILVRPAGDRFEIVCGERRYRAVRLLNLETIAAVVREFDDVAAAKAALAENVDRATLTPWETAAGIRSLLGLGANVDDLARLLHCDAERIDAAARLAELPDFWQEWLRTRDDRRGPAAEMLVPYLDLPEILEAMERAADAWPMALSDWRRRLTEIVLRLSRDADPDSPVGPAFKLTQPVLRKLDVRDVRVGREVQQRAFAVDVFDDLQGRALGEAWKGATAEGETAESRGPRAEGQRDASAAAESSAPSAGEVGVDPLGDEPAADFEGRLEEWFGRWLRRLIASRLDELDLPGLGELVESLGVDLEAEWRLSRGFLELFSGSQLRQLAGELGVSLDDCESRGEAIAALLSSSSHPLPARLADLTGVPA